MADTTLSGKNVLMVVPFTQFRREIPEPRKILKPSALPLPWRPAAADVMD
jgi:hypothetical protein